MNGFILITYVVLKFLAAITSISLIAYLIQNTGGSLVAWALLAIYVVLVILALPIGVAIQLMEDN